MCAYDGVALVPKWWVVGLADLDLCRGSGCPIGDLLSLWLTPLLDQGLKLLEVAGMSGGTGRWNSSFGLL